MEFYSDDRELLEGFRRVHLTLDEIGQSVLRKIGRKPPPKRGDWAEMKSCLEIARGEQQGNNRGTA